MSNTPGFSVSSSESSRTPDVGLVLENTSFVPFYEQISEHIRALIHAGKLVAGQSYYSEGEIARSLGISKMPAQIFPEIDSQDLENQSLYDVMENTYERKLQRAEEIIGAIKAGEKDAHLLQTEPDSAFLIIRETTYDEEDVAIEYSVSLLRGDRYTAYEISVRKQARLAARHHSRSMALI